MDIHMKRCHEPYLGINIGTHIWSGENHANVLENHHRSQKQMKSWKSDNDYKRRKAFPQYQKDISHPLDVRRNMRVKCNKEVLYAWIRLLRSATS